MAAARPPPKEPAGFPYSPLRGEKGKRPPPLGCFAPSVLPPVGAERKLPLPSVALPLEVLIPLTGNGIGRRATPPYYGCVAVTSDPARSAAATRGATFPGTATRAGR